MRQDISYEQARQARMAMIAGQIQPNRVSDERVLAAMREVPRERFVPKSRRGIAYIDEDLEIAEGRYLLEPMVFARLVMAAEIEPGDAVLDVGCGSGYSTAVLAHLGECVVGLEEDRALAKQAGDALSALGVDNAAVIEAPLSQGAPDQGPFDVIVLEGAVERIPDGLVEQLADGGRLVCVRVKHGRSCGYVLTKTGGVAGGREFCDAFVPMLPGFAAPRGFQF